MQSIRFTPRAKTATVWILFILAMLFLYQVRGISLIFFWAIVTAYIFHPIIRFLTQRTRIHQVWWIILLYVSLGMLFYWAIAVLVPVAVRQYDELLVAAPDIIRDIQSFIQENSRIEFYGFTLNLETLAEELVTVLGDLVRNLPEQAIAGVTLVFETLAKGIIYLIAVFYFLLHGEKWVQQGFSLLPPHVQSDLRPLFHRINVTLLAYIRGQLLTILIMGTLTYIGLAILRVRFALVLALISGVLEIVPFLGPVAAGGVTILVVLFQPTIAFGWSNLTMAIVVAILYTILHQVENDFVVPNLLGYMMDLSPLLVIFVVLAGGSLAGPVGLLLAIPIAASIKIILRYLYAKLTDKPVVFEELPRPPKRPRRRIFRRRKETRQ